MKVKIEDASSRKLKRLEENVDRVLGSVPAEHLRGFNKLVFVDLVNEPRISPLQRSTLPALYHPRMGGQMAWGEIATSVLSPKKRFPKSIMVKMALKANLAQIILSLIAQHYHLTLSKGIKKTQLEPACRSYVEKYFEVWRDRQGGIRARLFRPFRPFLDRLAKKLARKYRAEMDRKKSRKK